MTTSTNEQDRTTLNATLETCPCGKRSHATRTDAERLVLEAKISAGVRGRPHRRESNVYPCPTNPAVWHTTSRATPPPAYGPDDDEAAESYIGRAVHNSDNDPEPWTHLYADDRVEQTVRVLGRIHQSVLAQESQRRSGIEALKARSRAREIDRSAVWDAERERAEWAKRTAYFKASVVARLQEGRAKVKALRMRRADNDLSVQSKRDRATIARLAKAVAEHRAAVVAPTEADRRLWAWLGVLSTTHGKCVVSLAELLETEWANDPKPDTS